MFIKFGMIEAASKAMKSAMGERRKRFEKNRKKNFNDNGGAHNGIVWFVRT